jgi:hypothetical protein
LSIYTHGAGPRGKVIRSGLSKVPSVGQPARKLAHIGEPFGDRYVGA